MVGVTLVAIVGWSLAILGGLLVTAQRQVIAKKKNENWRLTDEMTKVMGEVDVERRYTVRLQEAYNHATDKALEYASKAPIVIEPPDLANIVSRVGDAIGLAIYGRQQEVKEELTKQMRETSMVHEQPQSGEWYPDVEFDPQMGAPPRGGWVNGPQNANAPPGENQVPTHAVDENGRLVRLDGQSVFQAGIGGPMPAGGVE